MFGSFSVDTVFLLLFFFNCFFFCIAASLDQERAPSHRCCRAVRAAAPTDVSLSGWRRVRKKRNCPCRSWWYSTVYILIYIYIYTHQCGICWSVHCILLFTGKGCLFCFSTSLWINVSSISFCPIDTVTKCIHVSVAACVGLKVYYGQNRTRMNVVTIYDLLSCNGYQGGNLHFFLSHFLMTIDSSPVDSLITFWPI